MLKSFYLDGAQKKGSGNILELHYIIVINAIFITQIRKFFALHCIF